jgi:hypothetical protein
MESSFLNVQFGQFYPYDGTAVQHNSDGSAGNIQINFGLIGTLFVGNGYSFNLQFNIGSPGDCLGENDQIYTLRGNLKIVRCSDEKYFYHDDGDVIYKINFLGDSPCNNDNFMEVRDGKVYITLCVGN